MSVHLGWELRSNGGDAVARWLVREAPAGPHDVIVCDLELSSSYAGQAGDDHHPVVVEARQLAIRRSELEEIVHRLLEWANLPLARLAITPLNATFVVGATFDNTVTLTFGARADVISGHNQTATFSLRMGKLRGEFVFVTDQSCIRSLCYGMCSVREALGWQKWRAAQLRRAAVSRRAFDPSVVALSSVARHLQLTPGVRQTESPWRL